MALKLPDETEAMLWAARSTSESNAGARLGKFCEER